ncbi:hypothetical protein BJ741DRAFT_632779 [Chytriomyces cf. hyalinus JEL632]|nr:hypothetical protein BJ741DRAFT_632779 [Chytriomyces cf. hyalinus JEL632]
MFGSSSTSLQDLAPTTFHLPPGFTSLSVSCTGLGSCEVVFDAGGKDAKARVSWSLLAGTVSQIEDTSVHASNDSDQVHLTVQFPASKLLSIMTRKPTLRMHVSVPFDVEHLAVDLSDGTVLADGMRMRGTVSVNLQSGIFVSNTAVSCRDFTVTASNGIALNAGVIASHSASLSAGIGNIVAQTLVTKTLAVDLRNGHITIQKASASSAMTFNLGFGQLDAIYDGYETCDISVTTGKVCGAFWPGSPASVTEIHVNTGLVRGIVHGFRGTLTTKCMGGEIRLGRAGMTNEEPLELRSPGFRPLVAMVGESTDAVSATGKFNVKRDIHGDGNLLMFGYIKLDFDTTVVVRECGGVKDMTLVVGKSDSKAVALEAYTVKAAAAPAIFTSAAPKSGLEALMQFSQARYGLF